jgi:hypothetical protein
MVLTCLWSFIFNNALMLAQPSRKGGTPTTETELSKQTTPHKSKIYNNVIEF